jgi:hypothetical protein
MDILKRIQSDLLDQDVSLPSILRKAMVLASQLPSDELQNWVSQELDGYEPGNELPDYRVLKTRCLGNWTNGYYQVSGYGVPLSEIKNENLKKRLTTFRVSDGIRTVEQLAARQEMHLLVSADITAMVNGYVSEDGYGYSELEFAVRPHHFEQILDTVRNRLLKFVLKLNANWHIDDKPPSKSEVQGLLSVTIFNNQPGADMSVFDQRGQQVNYQYNAAGNININAAQNKNELADEIEKLKEEIERAKESKAIDPDVAVEAEYHLIQAAKEARKERPKKGVFLQYIEKAKGLLEGLPKVTELVTALYKAAEVASKIF